MTDQVKKGIILAGGNGTRLYPLTNTACKQLLPVYDKPMIYYPLSTLMLIGVKEILLISTPEDISHFERLFGNGKKIGLSIEYAIQEKPEGIAQALIIGDKFIGDDPVALILGDNIFYGIDTIKKDIDNFQGGALIFGYYMKDPRRYGVVELDKTGKVISIIEKPDEPKSNYAVTGMYLYDSGVVDLAKSLKPSARGELEITDINNNYLKAGNLKVTRLGRGVAWLDTGTFESLLTAGNYIATIEKRQGLKIGCIEEVALRKKLINRNQYVNLIENMESNEYREYLNGLLRELDNGR